MKWSAWRAPRKPSIARPPLPGLKKQRDGRKFRYKCIGGPFDGQVLVLTDGNSSIFSVPRGKYGAVERGRYEAAIVAGRGLFSYGETKWRPR